MKKKKAAKTSAKHKPTHSYFGDFQFGKTLINFLLLPLKNDIKQNQENWVKEFGIYMAVK